MDDFLKMERRKENKGYYTERRKMDVPFETRTLIIRMDSLDEKIEDLKEMIKWGIKIGLMFIGIVGLDRILN